VKILIVSDIHANLDAYEAVLAAERGAYEGFVCLGDTTGYGCDPAECVDLVRAAAGEAVLSIVLAGNHDAVLSGRVDASWFNASALKSVGFTRMRLGSAALDWLAALPASADVLITAGNGSGEPTLAAIAAHGSADQPLTGYLWGGEETVETYAAMASRAVPLCLVGHTHVASVFSYGGFGAVSPRGVLTVGGGAPVIANPGSVGFPREFGLFADIIGEGEGARAPEPEPLSIERYPAYYALWDTEARTVSFRDARYDRGPFDRRLAAAGL
jgi:predicted phosphodiesterase